MSTYITYNKNNYTFDELKKLVDDNFPHGEDRGLILEALWACCASQDGMSMIAEDGTTILSNTAHQKIMGVDGLDMVGKNVDDLVNEGIIQQSAAAKVLKTKQQETILQTLSNGKVVLVTATPLFDENGKLQRIISNMRDVPALKQIYDEKIKQEALLENYKQTIQSNMQKDIEGIIAESNKMRNVLRYAARIASNESSVLILGESGVGKGLVAKAIHSLSKRSKNPFVSINCGAIPEQLLESELFGYCRGAFTGANKDGKIGLLEVADGGTVMLDEIGELPLSLQPKLLKFLEEGEISKIGGTEVKKVDSRIIAVTNKNLRDMVEHNKFREDLYYRLNVIPLIVPPLRERKEDIAPLVMHFLAKQNKKNGCEKIISPNLMEALEAYDWPGNVRQLRNMIERLVALSFDNVITTSDLPNEDMGTSQASYEEINWPVSLLDIRRNVEEKWINRALENSRSIREAAKLLSITPSMMYRYMNR